MRSAGVAVRVARWPEERDTLARIRERVFVEEQGVPPALEWDTHDARATHLVARGPAGEAIGTARLLPSGQIGRMAVLAEWRGRGVGDRLLDEVIAIARMQGFSSVFLNAQVQVRGFYARHGFRAVGPAFEEAGIPHVRMVLGLLEP